MNSLLQRLLVVLMLAAGPLIIPEPAQATIPAAERAALLTLYNDTNGASWTTNTSWNGTAGTECAWFGVTCDVGETMVTGLDLRNNNLVGTIPSAIGDLTNLEVLNLRSNVLSGGIPVEIGSLTALVDLNLRSNQLSGGIPDELGQLTNLTILNLRNNLLTGSIPVELGDLTALQELYLRSNELTGEIPAELGNLTNLVILSLRSNRLTGTIPGEIGNLTNLQELYLRSNILVGEIPASFINLTNLILDGLNLRYNAIHTDDATLATQLNTVHAQEGSGARDFSQTQTMDADGVVATSVGDTEVDLGWNAVSYTDHDGGYRIYRSTNANNGFTMVDEISGKATVTANLTGLTACTTYFVRVHSYTDAHPGNDVIAGNKSEVESDGLTGNVAQFTTTGCPVANPTPPAGGGGGGGCSLIINPSFDPVLPLLILISCLYLARRRHSVFTEDFSSYRR